MQLAREPLALVLLRRDHLAQQLLAPRVALLELAVETLELPRALLDAPLELAVRPLDVAHRRLERHPHLLERPAQPADFVLAEVGNRLVQIAVGDPLGRVGEQRDRVADAAGGAPGEQEAEAEQRGAEPEQGEPRRRASARAPPTRPAG